MLLCKKIFFSRSQKYTSSGLVQYIQQELLSISGDELHPHYAKNTQRGSFYLFQDESPPSHKSSRSSHHFTMLDIESQINSHEELKMADFVNNDSAPLASAETLSCQTRPVSVIEADKNHKPTAVVKPRPQSEGRLDEEEMLPQRPKLPPKKVNFSNQVN